MAAEKGLHSHLRHRSSHFPWGAIEGSLHQRGWKDAAQKSARNYKNDVLIDVVEEILPNGQVAWEAVAAAYHTKQTKRRIEIGTMLRSTGIKICAIT
jgi:hypothetical protein